MTTRYAPQVYRFDPLDHSGLLFGLPTIACAALLTGAVLAVVLVTAGVAVPAAALAPLLAAAATVPGPGGVAAWERLLPFVHHLRGRGGRAMWHAPLAEDGPFAPCLSGAIVSGGDRAEIVARSAGSVTVVIPVYGTPLALTAPGEADVALGHWGDLLSQLAAEPAVSHLAWIHHTRARAHAAAGRGDGLRRDDSARRSYADVVELVSASAADHEAALALTVRRESDIDRVVAAANRGLVAARLAADRPLSASEVRRLVARRADPFAASGAERLLAVHTAWDHCRLDGACHRAYWVEAWPATPVVGGWLDPFLHAASTARTFTVVAAPVTRHQARRRIERDLVKLESDAMHRHERGRRVDARHHRVTDALLGRERELVDGHAEYRFVGLVDIAAPDPAALAAEAASVEQAALDAGLVLRPLHGRHDKGWAATLPLGLAPRMAGL